MAYQSILTGALDYETIQSYKVVVKLVDTGQLESDKNAEIVIKVSDINEHTPKFTATEYKCDFDEDAAKDSLCTTFTACAPFRCIFGLYLPMILLWYTLYGLKSPLSGSNAKKNVAYQSILTEIGGKLLSFTGERRRQVRQHGHI